MLSVRVNPNTVPLLLLGTTAFLRDQTRKLVLHFFSIIENFLKSTRLISIDLNDVVVSK